MAAGYEAAIAHLDRERFSAGLWSRQLDLWTEDQAVQKKIAGRLGWLDAVQFVTPLVPRMESFANRVRAADLDNIVLLGMGGSSLAPEVLRRVLGRADQTPRFKVLDSTDPLAVQHALENASSSLFVIASKSGTTIEPNSMAAEARRRVIEAGIQEWGSRFVAITDNGTELHQRAIADRFLEVFVNPSDIGGRYSALSLFGLVPAAMMGIPLRPLLDSARRMVEACHSSDARTNPGIALGALMSAGVREGRDKLTLLLPGPLDSFGLWVEQLIAESTGKQGTGVVPVAGERATPAAADRIAVAVRVGREGPPDEVLEDMRNAGVPLATIALRDTSDLGAEFFRWEIATATAGWCLGVNPFDEPNVQEAKQATGELLSAYATAGELPREEPAVACDGMQFTVSAAARPQVAQGLRSFLKLAQPSRDYVALLVFGPPDDPDLEAAIANLRAGVAEATQCATTSGFGPRYLHSTGQLHKGGANNGVFVMLTADGSDDLPVPDAPYSFGVLELAQALGDFRSLDQAGRRVLHAHLSSWSPAAFDGLSRAIIGG